MSYKRVVNLFFSCALNGYTEVYINSIIEEVSDRMPKISKKLEDRLIKIKNKKTERNNELKLNNNTNEYKARSNELFGQKRNTLKCFSEKKSGMEIHS